MSRTGENITRGLTLTSSKAQKERRKKTGLEKYLKKEWLKASHM